MYKREYMRKSLMCDITLLNYNYMETKINSYSLFTTHGSSYFEKHFFHRSHINITSKNANIEVGHTNNILCFLNRGHDINANLNFNIKKSIS